MVEPNNYVTQMIRQQRFILMTIILMTLTVIAAGSNSKWWERFSLPPIFLSKKKQCHKSASLQLFSCAFDKFLKAPIL